MDDLKKIIGNNISKLRKNYGLTQVEFAEKLNYSDKSVSKWERGESLPDIVVLKTIAKFFNVTIDVLTTEYKSDKALLMKSQKYKNVNRLIIALISFGGCWVVATLLFVMFRWFLESITSPEMVFLWTGNISLLVLLVFNFIWGRKIWSEIILSALLWYLATSIFITVNIASKWLIYIVCIPIQIVIILAFLMFSKKKNKKIEIENALEQKGNEE